MFGRLLKQQLKSTYKEFNILYAAIILVGVLSAICFKLKSEIFIIILTLLLITTLMGSIIIYFIYASKMLYGSMYEKQGYLTFTLPVSPHSLIITKILSILLYTFGFILSIILAIIICSLIIDLSYIENVGEVLADIAETVIKNPLSFLFNLLNIAISLCSFLLLLQFVFALANTGKILRNKRGLAVVLIYLGISFIISLISIFDPIELGIAYYQNRLVIYDLSNHGVLSHYGIFTLWDIIINVLTIVVSYVLTIKIFKKGLEL